MHSLTYSSIARHLTKIVRTKKIFRKDLFLLAASLVVIIVQQAFLRQIRTFRHKSIFVHDILAEIERWKPDDITDLESFLLDVPGHGDWCTGWISWDLPSRTEEFGGDDRLTSPPHLVVVLISVIISTQTSGGSSQTSWNLEQGLSELRAGQTSESIIYPDVEVSSLIPANLDIVLGISHCIGDFRINQNFKLNNKNRTSKFY